jgi:uncharacterized protein
LTTKQRGVDGVADFFKRVRKGLKAAKESFGPTQCHAGGIQVVCPHCQHDAFQEGSAQLNTAGMTFLGLDWLNKSASLLVCVNCGQIQWFGKQPNKV